MDRYNQLKSLQPDGSTGKAMRFVPHVQSASQNTKRILADIRAYQLKTEKDHDLTIDLTSILTGVQDSVDQKIMYFLNQLGAGKAHIETR